MDPQKKANLNAKREVQGEQVEGTNEIVSDSKKSLSNGDDMRLPVIEDETQILGKNENIDAWDRSKHAW